MHRIDDEEPAIDTITYTSMDDFAHSSVDERLRILFREVRELRTEMKPVIESYKAGMTIGRFVLGVGAAVITIGTFFAAVFGAIGWMPHK